MSTDRFQTGDFDAGTFYPYVCDLSAVTKAVNAVVTTSIDHGFVVGNVVQFFVPSQYGMTQLDGLTGRVLSVGASNQITVDINTTDFDVFSVPVLPSLVVISPAQVTGVGDRNYGPQTAFGIPGAFRNTPP